MALKASEDPKREDRQDVQQQLLAHAKRQSESLERTEAYAQKTAQNTWDIATDPKARIGLWVAIWALIISTLLAIPGAINETKTLFGIGSESKTARKTATDAPAARTGLPSNAGRTPTTVPPPTKPLAGAKSPLSATKPDRSNSVRRKTQSSGATKTKGH